MATPSQQSYNNGGIRWHGGIRWRSSGGIPIATAAVGVRVQQQCTIYLVALFSPSKAGHDTYNNNSKKQESRSGLGFLFWNECVLHYTNFSITTAEFLVFPVNLSMSFLLLIFLLVVLVVLVDVLCCILQRGADACC